MQGSIVNRLMEASRPKVPNLGDGATICHYSDRSSATVVAVRLNSDGSLKEVDVVGDQVGPNKRVWPDQEYDIVPGWVPGDPQPERVSTYRVDRKGRLRATYVNHNGRRVLSNGGPGIALGSRDHYSDPSF